MREWLALAITPSVVKRSVKYSLIVGFVLTLINHSDAIFGGKVTFSRMVRIMLTFLVPYTVSTLSSVGALLEQRRASANGGLIREQDAGRGEGEEMKMKARA